MDTDAANGRANLRPKSWKTLAYSGPMNGFSAACHRSFRTAGDPYPNWPEVRDAAKERFATNMIPRLNMQQERRDLRCVLTKSTAQRGVGAGC